MSQSVVRNGAGIAAALGALLGCPIHADAPRQNETWSDPPAQYGHVRFEGLRAPTERLSDAGFHGWAAERDGPAAGTQ